MTSWIDSMIKVSALGSRHRKTLDDVMTEPPKSGIKWDDVVALIKAVGGTIKNNNGSRRKFQIGTTKFSTHEPHPKNVMDKGAVAGLKEWFVNCVGVDYE